MLFGLVFGAGLGVALSLDNPGVQIGVALGLVQSKVAAEAKRADIPLNWAIYLNCDQVRSAGAAPLRREDPGYAERLDPDGDGVACATARQGKARRKRR